MSQYVSYLRVSTDRQGKSGLGMDAQRQAVLEFINGNGHVVLKEFIETETGKGSNALAKRPVLKEALDFCRKNKAVLVVAKLDRLARNVAFVSALMESKVEFVCCDFPQANRLTIHILSAVAEHEREMISKRTKEALAAARRRGVKLGSPSIGKLVEQRKREAHNFAESIRAEVERMQAEGLSQRKIVEALNERDTKAPRGGRWTLLQVQRLLKRLKAA